MSLLLDLDFCLVLVGVLVALVPGVVGACFSVLCVSGCVVGALVCVLLVDLILVIA